MNTPLEAVAQAVIRNPAAVVRCEPWALRAVVAAYLKARAEPGTDDEWPTPQAWARQAWAAVLLAELEGEGDTCDEV